MFRERVRLRFARKGDLRFVAHQDLMRVFERALRRSGLPLRLTEGFNRHVRLSFPLPLAVGWEAENEVIEFELAEWISVGEIQNRLAPQLPGGLGVTSMTLGHGGETAQAVEAEYLASPAEAGQRAGEPATQRAGEPVAEALKKRISQEGIEAFLKCDNFEVERLRKERTKRVNIRPYVIDLRAEDDGLRMRMRVSQDGTSRPEEVLEGLGFSAAEARDGFRIVRTRVKLKGE